MTAMLVSTFLCLAFAQGTGGTSAGSADTTDSLRLGADVVPTFEAVRLVLDPRKPDYTGTVTIDLDVRRATPSFRLHAEEMTVGRLSLVPILKSGAQRGAEIAVMGRFGEGALFHLTADRPLTPGPHRLTIDFTNDFGTRATGLYRLESGGLAYSFTQFEADDAREAFPCFDEPAFKIPWQMTFVVPEQDLAITNTPMERESTLEGQKTIVFRRTPPMSAYFLAIATGPLETVPITGMSVPGKLVTVKGQGALTAEAGRMSPLLLAALEKYFGRPYPYEKLDLLGVPEFWPGAMENAGAITFADRILLLDPSAVSPARRKVLASVIAHEMAHMWYGDLVTMEWWDDLWLNESFATWMGEKIAHQVYPDLRTDLSMVTDGDRAMITDGKVTSRAIRQPVSSLANLLQSADVLAYQKGQAVLGMFERWTGPDKFRQGVHDYLAAHEWKNARAADLWGALSKASGKDVTTAMGTFLDQPGLPIISLELRPGGRVEMSQERFLPAAAVRGEPQRWKVPVVLKYADATGVHKRDVLLTETTQTVDLGSQTVRWVYPNDDAWGYYRWKMPPDALAELAAKADSRLDARERMDFVYNSTALVDAGALHADTYLGLLAPFANDAEPLVIGTVLDGLTRFEEPLVPEDLKDEFARYVRFTLGPALERFGRLTRAGEPDAVGLIRPRLLLWLADKGQDPSARAFADSLARAFLSDPAKVDPALGPAVLNIAAMRGDRALLDAYRQRFEATQSPAHRRALLTGLAHFRDPALRTEMLRYTLEGPLKPQEIITVANIMVEDDPAAREVVYDWITKNYEAIGKRVPPMLVVFLPHAAEGCSPELLGRAESFFSEPAHRPPGTEREIAEVREAVQDCVSLREREGARIRNYLSRPVGAN